MGTTLNNISFLKDTRIHLLRNMTEAELVLWEVLKENCADANSDGNTVLDTILQTFIVPQKN
jgi:hypothetical protein